MPPRLLPAPVLGDEHEKLDQEVAARKRDESRPFPVDDNETPRDALARNERRAYLGLIPRRSLWPELADLDKRVFELQQRHGEAVARLHQLTEQRRLAPEQDAEAMAEWIASGEKGRRPEATTKPLDDRIREAEQEVAGSQLALDRALQARADFIARNRKRLRAVTTQQREAEQQRLHHLLDEVKASRAALTELRESEVYISLFPHEAVGSQPPFSKVCGGLSNPVKETLQLTSVGQLEVARVLDLLHRDADWCGSVAPKEMVVQSRDPDPQREAIWMQNAADVQNARHRELEKIRAAARREFGHEPNELELESFMRARAAGEV